MSRSSSISHDCRGQWEKEFDDLARAFSGAFLFATPLLFTMEMWWIGTYTELLRLLVFLTIAFGVNVMLAYMAGFKEESTLSASVTQAVESVAVGAVASTVVLLALNRIAPGDPLDSILGKIVLQTIPLSIGASVANAILTRAGGGQGGQGGQDVRDGNNGGNGGHGSGSKQRKAGPLHAALLTLGAGVGGGILIGFSIAPTEEVPMLATELGYGHKLALIILSLVVTYLIVFESGFSPQSGGSNGNGGDGSDNNGPFRNPITETVLAYITALLVAFAALYLFDQIALADPLPDIISKVLVLGTPTAIGGAAGRALIGVRS